MKKINIHWNSVLTVCVALLVIVGCKKEPIVSMTSSQVNITGYLEKDPGKFSEWSKILEITGNAGFLQAYGNYTMFAPTNDGVKKYLADMGKTSVEQLNVDELKQVVRFHLLEDTISSRQFGDGKLNTLTMLGQYLVTGSLNSGGQTSIVINRQANVDLFNVRLGNGYLHVIDNVLRPAKLTVAQMLKANPAEYSIFTEALEATGLFDALNVLPANNPKPDERFFTLIAEPNSVLKVAKIESYADLLKTYNSGNSNLKNPENGLYKYLAYHILPGAKYLADIASSQSHLTFTYPEILQSKFRNREVILDDMEFNGNYEPGVQIVKAKSDISAVNGVLHTVGPYQYNHKYTNANGDVVTAQGTTSGHFAIKVRVPFPVYWDVADMPETRNSGFFRTGGSTNPPAYRKTSATAPSPVKGWDWPKTGDGFTYFNGLSGGQDPGHAWVNRDYLNLFLGNVANNLRQPWIDMKTPVIVRGEYYVWVCWRRKNQSSTWPSNDGTTARVRIDGGDPSPKTFAFAEPIPFGDTKTLEQMGWKFYTSTGNPANPWDKIAFPYNKPWQAKNLGLMKIETTGEHTLRMEAIRNSQNANNLDMIHFIPKDWASQILPRFKPDGTPDFTDYPGTH